MKPNYLCFLLRIWQVGDQDGHVRALLEDPSSKDVVGFASVQDLCAHLQKVSHDLAQAPSIGEMGNEDMR
jgi:hypothetical protein